MNYEVVYGFVLYNREGAFNHYVVEDSPVRAIGYDMMLQL